MAITKTTTVQRVEVYPAADSSAEATENAAHETLMVCYLDSFDDSGDDTLPVTTNRVIHLTKFDNEGNATDVSTQDTLVQTICTALWS